MSKLKDLITRAIRAQQEYLAKYRTGHTTLGCRVTHMIGVPMIMASMVAFVLYLTPPLTVTAIIAKYAFTQPSIDNGLFLFRVALPNVLSDILVTPTGISQLIAGIALFGIGWLLQFAGHKFYEKNSPLFLSHPFNPLSYTTAVIFIAQEYGQLITRPFTRAKK